MRDASDSGMAIRDMTMSLMASDKTSMFVTDRRWLFLKKAMQRRMLPKKAVMLMKKRIPTSATTKAVDRLVKVIGKCAWVKLASIVPHMS